MIICNRIRITIEFHLDFIRYFRIHPNRVAIITMILKTHFNVYVDRNVSNREIRPKVINICYDNIF